MSIEEDYVHVTLGSKESDEECDLNYTFGEGVHREVDLVLSNSLGFGGHNATLAVRKYQ